MICQLFVALREFFELANEGQAGWRVKIIHDFFAEIQYFFKGLDELGKVFEDIGFLLLLMHIEMTFIHNTTYYNYYARIIKLSNRHLPSRDRITWKNSHFRFDISFLCFHCLGADFMGSYIDNFRLLRPPPNFTFISLLISSVKSALPCLGSLWLIFRTDFSLGLTLMRKTDSESRCFFVLQLFLNFSGIDLKF